MAEDKGKGNFFKKGDDDRKETKSFFNLRGNINEDFRVKDGVEKGDENNMPEDKDKESNDLIDQINEVNNGFKKMLKAFNVLNKARQLNKEDSKNNGFYIHDVDALINEFKHINDLTTKLSRLTDENNGLLNETKRLKSEIKKLNQNKETISASMKAEKEQYDVEFNNLKIRNEEKEKRLEKNTKDLEKIILQHKDEGEKLQLLLDEKKTLTDRNNTLRSETSTLIKNKETADENYKKSKKEYDETLLKLNDLKTVIDEMDLRKVGLEIQVSELKTEITNLESDITSKQEQVTNLNTDITNKQEQVTNLDTDITKKQEQVTNLTTDITNKQEEVIGLESDISNKQEQVTNLDTDISNKQEQVTNLDTDISNKQEQITNLDTDISNKQEQVTNLITDITNKQEQVTNLTTDITTKQEQVTDLESDIATKQEQVTDLDSDIATKQEQVTDLDSKLKSFTNVISELEVTKADLEEKIEKAKEDLLAISTSSKVMEAVQNLEGLVTKEDISLLATKEDVSAVTDMTKAELESSNESITTAITSLGEQLTEIGLPDEELKTLREASEGASKAVEIVKDTLEGIKGELTLEALKEASNASQTGKLLMMSNKYNRVEKENQRLKQDLSKVQSELQVVANLTDITQTARYNSELDRASYINLVGHLGMKHNEAEFLYAEHSSNLLKLMNTTVKSFSYDPKASYAIAEYFDKYFTEMVYMVTPETHTFLENLGMVQELADSGALISNVMYGKVHTLELKPKFLENLGYGDLLEDTKLSLASLNKEAALNYLTSLVPESSLEILEQAYTLSNNATELIYYTFNFTAMLGYDFGSLNLEKYIDKTAVAEVIKLKEQLQSKSELTGDKISFTRVAEEMKQRIWFINNEWLAEQFAHINSEDIGEGLLKINLVGIRDDESFAHIDTATFHREGNKDVLSVIDTIESSLRASRTSEADRSSNPFVNLSSLVPVMFSKKEVHK